MVSFDICKGNPGALNFLIQAYERDMFSAERGFRRMEMNQIEGDKLYMLWSDCCGRDTGLALAVIENMSIEEIVRHINYDAGRGIPITADEVRA